ncbi:MAG: hypothetical protein B6I31_05325 [Desulfobacteraceae bacterium 4572_19]|nr:MAG: hypothetical protein B6I31_05325 [Desulfobacteraceae bacterium 4572_19]
MLSFVKTIFKIATTSFLFFSIIFSTIYHSSVAEEIGTQKSVKPVSILNEGIITTIALNLRGGPGNNYKPIITLKKGTRIGFIRNREKYVQIIKKIVPEHKPDLKSKYKPEQKPEYKPDPQNLKEPEKKTRPTEFKRARKNRS